MGKDSEIAERREAGPQRRDNILTVGLHPDTWREFEDWRVERDLEPSEAARRLLRRGLDEDTASTGLQQNAPVFLFAGLLGVLFVLWGEPLPPQEVAYATVAFFVCWVTLQFYPNKIQQVIHR